VFPKDERGKDIDNLGGWSSLIGYAKLVLREAQAAPEHVAADLVNLSARSDSRISSELAGPHCAWHNSRVAD
jgi:hypothetical protein